MHLPSFLVPTRSSQKLVPQSIKCPRRTLGIWTNINPQSASRLTNLPAELRNKIYIYVFNSPSDSIETETHHPLALLLTCRALALETSTLAFSTHTFFVRGDLTLRALRQRISILPDAHFYAITSVSFTPQIWSRYKAYYNPDAEFLANAIFLLPNLSRIAILMSKDDTAAGTDSDDKVGIYQAQYLWATLGNMVDGSKARMWKTEESWQWKYADVEMDKKKTWVDCLGRRKFVEQDPLTGRMERIDKNVENCKAVLVQRGTERTVEVHMCLVEGIEVKVTRRADVRLVPGLIEGSGVEEVRGRSGMVGYRYDPGGMLGADLENRNLLMSKGTLIGRGMRRC
jgi:hypothetical protein